MRKLPHASVLEFVQETFAVCVSPNACIEILMPNVMVLEVGTLGGVYVVREEPS